MPKSTIEDNKLLIKVERERESDDEEKRVIQINNHLHGVTTLDPRQRSRGHANMEL